VNKTVPLFAATILAPFVSLMPGVLSHKVQLLPAVAIGSLAVSLWGGILVLTSIIQRSAPSQVDAPRPPVVATGSVWGVGG